MFEKLKLTLSERAGSALGKGPMAALALLASLPVLDVPDAHAALTREIPFARDSVRGLSQGPHIPSPEAMLNDIIQRIEVARMQCVALPEARTSVLPTIDKAMVEKYQELYMKARGILAFPQDKISDEEVGQLVTGLQKFVEQVETDVVLCKSAQQ